MNAIVYLYSIIGSPYLLLAIALDAQANYAENYQPVNCMKIGGLVALLSGSIYLCQQHVTRGVSI